MNIHNTGMSRVGTVGNNMLCIKYTSEYNKIHPMHGVINNFFSKTKKNFFITWT